LVIAFTEYLQKRFVDEEAHTLYARFKKIINSTVEHDVIKKNPTTTVSIKIDNGALKKDVLSPEETMRLISRIIQGRIQI